jgi:hypothetical protein
MRNNAKKTINEKRELILNKLSNESSSLRIEVSLECFISKRNNIVEHKEYEQTSKQKLIAV